MKKRKDYVSPLTTEMDLRTVGVIAQSTNVPQGDWFNSEQVW